MYMYVQFTHVRTAGVGVRGRQRDRNMVSQRKKVGGAEAFVCVCVGGTQELKERTQQPEAHLKVILADLCDYDMAGENKGKYQLKAEYR